MIERNHFKAIALHIRNLQDTHKDNIEKVLEHADDAGIDRAGLRRFVSWKRKDPEKRAQNEAIDQQCQYLAGERDTPAVLPVGCELAQAINCFRRNMTVREVAEELRISTGKAGKLRQLARMFDVGVHVHDDVDSDRRLDVITPPEVAALPAHDPDTGEVQEADEGRPVVEIAADIAALPTEQAAIAVAVVHALADDDLAIPKFLDRRHSNKEESLG